MLPRMMTFPFDPGTAQSVKGSVMCEKCGTHSGKVSWSIRHHAWVCFNCFLSK